jgi:MoaA/NifB/PqqE/SkfB family radical SAM enzyme
MNYYQQVKNYTLTQVISTMLGMLGSSSDDTLIKMTYLAEKMAKKDYYIRQIQRIRNLFQAGHPSIQVARRIMTQSSFKHRQKLVECFVINQMLLGTNKRKEFSESPGGFYPPGLYVISPTMRCNLNCYGCYSSEYDRKQDLSFELMDKVVRETKELGIHFAVISGGEPFLHKNLLDLFELHNDVAFMVYTHGGFLNQKLVTKLADLGNVMPCISLEGFEEETDARRGRGHYQNVMRAMNMLREAGILFGFSATLTSKNAEVILSDRYIDIFVEKGCVLGWYFTYIPIGRKPDLGLMPTPLQRNQLRERVRYFRETKPILFGDFMGDGALVGGCLAAGRKYFHVNSHGDVEPCVFCHYAVDNVRDKHIKEILNSSFFQAIRAQIPYNKNLYRPCMLRDKPEVARRAIDEHGARPTHAGAEIMFTELAEEMDRVAAEYAAVSDPIWEAEQKEKLGKDNGKPSASQTRCLQPPPPVSLGSR